jgi:hypothetical protein
MLHIDLGRAANEMCWVLFGKVAPGYVPEPTPSQPEPEAKKEEVKCDPDEPVIDLAPVVEVAPPVPPVVETVVPFVAKPAAPVQVRKSLRKRVAPPPPLTESHVTQSVIAPTIYPEGDSRNEIPVNTTATEITVEQIALKNGDIATHVTVPFEKAAVGSFTAVPHEPVAPAVGNIFMAVYNELNGADRFIDYDPRWARHDRDGFNFDGALGTAEYCIDLQPGSQMCSMDDEGRHMIFIGTPFGDVVVYQPYKVHTLDMYQYNAPVEVMATGLMPMGKFLSAEQMDFLVTNDPPGNIGHRILNDTKLVAKKSKRAPRTSKPKAARLE